MNCLQVKTELNDSCTFCTFLFSSWSNNTIRRFWKAYSLYQNQIVGFNVIRSVSHVPLCLETSERDLLKSDYARIGVTLMCN